MSDKVVVTDFQFVRRRVIGNLSAKLKTFQRELLSKNRVGNLIQDLAMAKRQQLQSMLANYLGHFSHAHCYAPIAALLRPHAWLNITGFSDIFRRRASSFNEGVKQMFSVPDKRIMVREPGYLEKAITHPYVGCLGST